MRSETSAAPCNCKGGDSTSSGCIEHELFVLLSKPTEAKIPFLELPSCIERLDQKTKDHAIVVTAIYFKTSLVETKQECTYVAFAAQL